MGAGAARVRWLPGAAWSLLLALLAAAGCGGSVAGGETAVGVAREDAVATGLAAQGIAAVQRDAAVTLLASGHSGEYVYHGMSRQSFWVDLSVRGGSSSKEVGIVWSADDWATTNRALASYEGTLPDGREQWGVDVPGFYSGYTHATPEVRFAAFVTFDGATSWSPLRNHVIYEPVSAERPVRLLASALRFTESGEAFLDVKARALNVEGAIVWARLTTDGWRTTVDLQAHPEGEEWVVRYPLLDEQSETVEFVLSLELDGQRAWDNNGGKNFSHRILPLLEGGAFQDGLSVAASGIRLYAGRVASSLPVTSVVAVIDGATRHELPLLSMFPYDADTTGFLASGEFRFVLPLAELADGLHTLALEASVGGRTRLLPPVQFAVAGTVTSRQSWSVAGPAGSAWDFEVGADGAAYVMRGRTVEKYAAFGDVAPTVEFQRPPFHNTAHDITLDAQGRVYGAFGDKQLVRWSPDGQLDASFGAGGVIKLDGLYDGKPLCYAKSLAATPLGLYVSDSCNVRVLRFDASGAFVASVGLLLPGIDSGISGDLFYDGARVWVGREMYGVTPMTFFLVRLDDTGAGPTVEQVLRVDASAGRPESFAVTATGFWMTDSTARTLHFVDLTGTRVATWSGGGRVAAPGALDIPKGLTLFPDGSVAVLSVATSRVERFALRAP